MNSNHLCLAKVNPYTWGVCLLLTNFIPFQSIKQKNIHPCLKLPDNGDSYPEGSLSQMHPPKYYIISCTNQQTRPGTADKQRMKSTLLRHCHYVCKTACVQVSQDDQMCLSLYLIRSLAPILD